MAETWTWSEDAAEYQKAGVYEANRPDKGFDESGAAFNVNVDDGWVNAQQATDSHGKDVFAALTPYDARWLAARLIEAADVAEKHDRWKNGGT
jgi:hypothetical protein